MLVARRRFLHLAKVCGFQQLWLHLHLNIARLVGDFQYVRSSFLRFNACGKLRGLSFRLVGIATEFDASWDAAYLSHFGFKKISFYCGRSLIVNTLNELSSLAIAS